MAMNRIKTGDMVIIITGKDKGRQGKVLKVLGDRVLVEGTNMIKKHVRPNPQKNQQGGILDREASIHISNVALYNSASKKADRVGYKIVGDQDTKKKVRYFKSNNEIIDIK